MHRPSSSSAPEVIFRRQWSSHVSKTTWPIDLKFSPVYIVGVHNIVPRVSFKFLEIFSLFYCLLVTVSEVGNYRLLPAKSQPRPLWVKLSYKCDFCTIYVSMFYVAGPREKQPRVDRVSWVNMF